MCENKSSNQTPVYFCVYCLMDWILKLFGTGTDLDVTQMGLRAFTLYIIALILIRTSAIRTIGKKSSFDIVVSILLGAVLSRAIVGASPYWPTVFAGIIIVLLHRLLAWLCLRHPKLGIFLKGEERLLYCNGKFLEQNMKKSFLTDGDVLESVRLQTNKKSLEKVSEIYLERGGRISIIELDSR
jgi:uncharacterized membrane protein YcaP (DUF421 family)